MELTNDFRVAVPVRRAWDVLTDVERIAPCMPGAQLQEIAGEEYRGVVKVKVGPITAQYKGAARFLEKDDTGYKVVLRAEGRETRGQGNANATITAVLSPDGEGTAVSVVTDLTVTGKVAQFGRGVMADVSAKLLGQFVECLESKVLADPLAAGEDDVESSTGVPEGSIEENPEPAHEPARETVRLVDHPEPEPVDLIDTAGAPIAKRLAPILAIVAIGWLIRQLIRRRRS